MTSDFCGSVAAGSKVMVVWGELQAGGEALQVRPKSIWLLLAQVLLEGQSLSSVNFILQGFVEELQKQVGNQQRLS